MNRRRRHAFLLSLLFVAVSAVVQAQNAPVTINVDPTANRHPIDPRVYGIAHADAATLNDLNVPLNRSGGNNTTRYNWQPTPTTAPTTGTSRVIAYPSALAGRGRGHLHLEHESRGRRSPCSPSRWSGWVAKVGSNRSKLASFSIAKYGAQTGNDWQWFPDAGNGIRTGNVDVTGNDPNDANVPANSTFQKAWVDHLVARWGSRRSAACATTSSTTSRASGTRRTATSTRPARRWTKCGTRSSTTPRRSRRRTRPRSSSAPEEWGWSGYTLSAATTSSGAASHGWSNLPDRAAHGGWDYLPWLLDQLRQHEHADGPAAARRLHRPLLPAGRRVQQRHVVVHAAAAQPLDALALGPDLRRRDLDRRHGAARARA